MVEKITRIKKAKSQTAVPHSKSLWYLSFLAKYFLEIVLISRTLELYAISVQINSDLKFFKVTFLTKNHLYR